MNRDRCAMTLSQSARSMARTRPAPSTDSRTVGPYTAPGLSVRASGARESYTSLRRSRKQSVAPLPASAFVKPQPVHEASVPDDRNGERSNSKREPNADHLRDREHGQTNGEVPLQDGRASPCKAV